MPANYTDYLQTPATVSGTSVNTPYVSRWVRLVSNGTGTAYISTAATDTNGLFTITNLPPDVYTVYSGPSNTGPWTGTGDTSYNVPNDPVLFNVKDYGAKGDGVTDDTTAIQNTVNAVNTAGGGDVLLPPGTYITSAAINFTNATARIRCLGYGATIQPAATTDTIFVRQNNGSGTWLTGIYGLTIDGQNRATTVGIRIRDNDRAIVRDCHIRNCTTGIVVESFTTARWAEENAIMDSYIFNCTTGVSFQSPGGTFSLGETHMWNVGISNCGTGINLASPSTFYRCRLLGITIWLLTNGVGVNLDCNVQDSVFYIDFENQGGTQTGLTGVSVTANATNVTTLECHLGFTGTFANQVTDASTKGLIWKDGRSILTSSAYGGIGGVLEQWMYPSDTVPRVQLQTAFAGGGGLAFGDGSNNDTKIYRKQVKTLATDGAFARSTQVVAMNGGTVTIDCTLGELIKATLSASTTLAAPTNPVDGAVLSFRIFHDATSNVYTITWNAVFKRAGSAFANTNSNGAEDTITFQYASDLAVWCEVGRAINCG